jgi:hypothetical protein
MSLLT